MVAKSILRRTKDFLNNFPPFNKLSDEQLNQVASEIVIEYFEQGQYIFKQGEDAKAYFYILKKGSVQLFVGTSAEQELIDVCDEGDVFGARALISGLPYVSSAFVNEEALVYAIPRKTFAPILKENSEVSLYFASGFAAGLPVLRNTLETITQKRKNKENVTGIAHLQLQKNAAIKGKKKLITVPMGTSIQEAGKCMTTHKIGSIVVVNEAQQAVGIITDSDFRKKVVAKAIPISSPIEDIMSSPIIAASEESTLSDLMLMMLKNSIHHICITDNGKADGKAIGIITQHDLLVEEGKNAGVLLKEMQQAEDATYLAQLRDQADQLILNYLEQEVAMDFVAAMATRINDTLIERAIALSIEEMPHPPEIDFCWLSLGSEGREEQLLRTDLDNALVYENPPKDKADGIHKYFVALSEKVIDILTACGFEKCPANMMASNPEWCQPLDRWKKHFHSWIAEPEAKAVMFAAIFFDFRWVYGKAWLSEALTEYIFEQIGKHKIFLNHLAKNALKTPPPLGFFRDFILEKEGKNADKFDLKLRAMMPLTDIARVLTLQHCISNVNNTFKRYEKLAEVEPKNKAQFEEAAYAYEILMRFRAVQGIKAQDSGRFVEPKLLKKIDRQILKNTFPAIKSLQSLLEVRFQLGFFST